VPLLETRALSKHFDGLAAVNRVDLTVEEGEIVGLIGPNGAGKTTCFNLLSGFLRPTAGTIRFDGEDITGLRSHRIVRRGLVRTFQLTTLFAEMTALENVLLGLHLHSRRGLWRALSRRRAFPRAEIDESRVILEFTGLAAHGHQPAKNLPHGHQRILGIAMALAARPRLLLLDEPSLGLSPANQDQIFATIADLRGRGLTVLVVEQNAHGALQVSDTGIVMELGRLFMMGPAAEIIADPRIKVAYLGGERSATP